MAPKFADLSYVVKIDNLKKKAQSFKLFHRKFPSFFDPPEFINHLRTTAILRRNFPPRCEFVE